MDIYIVRISSKAKKELRKLPHFIIDKLEAWVRAIELEGLRLVQKIPGYHDERLKGKRFGQRSIRSNKAYRAIYTIQNNKIDFILVEEVNKHDY